MTDLPPDPFSAEDLLAVTDVLRQPPGSVLIAGTVTAYDATVTPGSATVDLADGSTIAAKSRLGAAVVLAAGDRVQVEFAKPHGVLVVALLT